MNRPVGKQAYVSVVTYRPPTPLNGAYCNALLLSLWSVRQKLNRVSSVQLRRAVRVLTLRSSTSRKATCTDLLEACGRTLDVIRSWLISLSVCCTTVSASTDAADSLGTALSATETSLRTRLTVCRTTVSANRDTCYTSHVIYFKQRSK